MTHKHRTCWSIAVLFLLSGGALSAQNISLELLGSYKTGVFDNSGAEIAAYDPGTRQLFVTNVDGRRIDVLSIADPAKPLKVFDIPVSSFGDHANSVDVKSGIVAFAVEGFKKTDPGRVVFAGTDGEILGSVTVGAQPDMLTFSPNGLWVLVANEGEPSDDYKTDPEGSISIIDISGGVRSISPERVRTATLTKFNGQTLDPSIRVFGPGATFAQDAEPEYIAVSPDSRTAYAVLQESNAIAVIDIQAAEVTRVFGLGLKDHSQPGNGLDASDRDNAINIANYPVFGMYMPDGIALHRYKGQDYLITANEGDSRAYGGYDEEARVSSLKLDPAAFPNAADLQANAKLGRLTVTKANGDRNGDGLYEQLWVFGARSFSVYSVDGTQVWDSGDQLEKITGQAYPANFNANNTENTFDNRSDNKGPEPEGVTLLDIGPATYAVIGLERIGGLMVYEITDPMHPRFVQYVNHRNFDGDPEAGTADDLGPEGLLFIPASGSPTREPLLVVANEVSGSTSIYRVKGVRPPRGNVSVSSTGFAFDQASGTWKGSLLLRNGGPGYVSAPFHIVLRDLPAGLTLKNGTGTWVAGPFLTISAKTPVESSFAGGTPGWVPGITALAQGQTIRLPITFEGPAGTQVQFKAEVYEGEPPVQ